jgi:hypothetical protein
MAITTTISKENPGSDLARAGGSYFRLERCNVNNIFKVAAQART